MDRSDYRQIVEEFYADAAQTPRASLCCTTVPIWRLPGLVVPQGMLERNYGCCTTIHPRDLATAERALYVGVGAGIEALQLSHFLRRKGAVVAIDKVPEMLKVAGNLLEEAASRNDWFDPSFVDLRSPALSRAGQGPLRPRGKPLARKHRGGGNQGPGST
jgi:hypothetical protein